jgi:AcrR family transcriptional regulator
MARWEPDAAGRLQQAALALFRERGYAEVTVAEIADRAGLTKRTFFNHFTDKREVLFAGARDYQASVVRHLTEADADLAPIDAAVLALTLSGLELAAFAEYARAREEIIASSVELRERDLMKTAALVVAIAGVLGDRGAEPRAATFAAQAALAVSTVAYADWAHGEDPDLHVLMRRALADLRRAIRPESDRGGVED